MVALVVAVSVCVQPSFGYGATGGDEGVTVVGSGSSAAGKPYGFGLLSPLAQLSTAITSACHNGDRSNPRERRHPSSSDRRQGSPLRWNRQRRHDSDWRHRANHCIVPTGAPPAAFDSRDERRAVTEKRAGARSFPVLARFSA